MASEVTEVEDCNYLWFGSKKQVGIGWTWLRELALVLDQGRAGGG